MSCAAPSPRPAAAEARDPRFAIDLLNTVFVAVVLVLHHMDYTRHYLAPVWRLWLVFFLRRFAVGGFFFLSGYKLARFKTDDTVRRFAANRLVRVYLPYVAAVLLFSVTAYPYAHGGAHPSWRTLAVHLACLQSVFPGVFQPDFQTLWFVSTLFLCYGFFLLSRRAAGHPSRFAAALCLTLLFVWFVRRTAARAGMDVFEHDLATHATCFAAGMLLARREGVILRAGSAALAAGFAAGLCCLVWIGGRAEAGLRVYRWADYALSLAVTLPAYALAFRWCTRRAPPRRLAAAAAWVSAGSFWVFLLHRPVWSVMARLWPERTPAQSAFVLGLGVPLILAAGHAARRLHDGLAARFSGAGLPRTPRASPRRLRGSPPGWPRR